MSKTYSAMWDGTGTFLFEKTPSKDVFHKIPASSYLISGNKVDPKTGEVLEERATYKHQGRTFTVYEDKEGAKE